MIDKELRLHSKGDSWLLVTLSGLSLFYVLYVFRGFGIDEGISCSGHSLLVRSLWFGTANAAVYYGCEFHASKFLKKKNVAARILLTCVELVLGATITFLLFNYFWSWTEFFWAAYSLLFLEYLFVMLIPIGIVTIVGLRNIKQKQEKQATHSLISFISENKKEEIHVKPEKFLFLKAAGNYVEVHFLEGNKKRYQLIRSSLKIIEEQYKEHPNFRRCHRSYIINPLKIEKVSRAKGKSSIQVEGEQIPVSSNCENTFHS